MTRPFAVPLTVLTLVAFGCHTALVTDSHIVTDDVLQAARGKETWKQGAGMRLRVDSVSADVHQILVCVRLAVQGGDETLHTFAIRRPQDYGTGELRNERGGLIRVVESRQLFPGCMTTGERFATIRIERADQLQVRLDPGVEEAVYWLDDGVHTSLGYVSAKPFMDTHYSYAVDLEQSGLFKHYEDSHPLLLALLPVSVPIDAAVDAAMAPVAIGAFSVLVLGCGVDKDACK